MSLLGFRPSSRSSSTRTAKPFSSSNTTLTSQAPPHSARGMAGVMDIERSRTRRERTYINMECCVCEESLEYTLRGERILQLSCGHVSHEACFYEYIREFESQQCPTCDATLSLDTSRGVQMDLGMSGELENACCATVLTHGTEKLSSIVRSVQTEPSGAASHRSAATPTPWDSQTVSSDHHQQQQQQQQHGSQISGRSRNGSDASGRFTSNQARQRDSSHSRDRTSDRGPSRQHMRSESGATGHASSHHDYAQDGRRHDYDVQSMETSLSSPRGLLKSPIPAPTVTVRSEFPTLSRSRQQQSLTCLITVEVTEGKWRADPEDMRGAVPPVPSIASATGSFKRPKSPVNNRQYETPYESTDVLDEVTEDLHARVDNWHGLDFSRFGKLRLHGHIRVGKDRQSWQELECYLFSEMLICVKEKKVATQPQWNEPQTPASKKTKCTLKGSILIKKHLNQVEHSVEEQILTLSLSVAELPSFHLQFPDRGQLEQWRRALMDIRLDFPTSNRMHDYDQDFSGTEEDDYRRAKRLSSVNSSYGAARSTMTAPTEYTNSRAGQPEPRLAETIHVPIDVVVVIPVSSSMQGLKINLLRDTLRFLVNSLGERDRMGLVTFGSSGGGLPIVGMTSKAWRDWPKVLDSIRPVGQKSLRADVVDGANVAMDLLMQRKSSNPLSSILLISDSSTSDAESVDFVISRAEAAK
jgi:hypothetical protein